MLGLEIRTTALAASRDQTRFVDERRVAWADILGDWFKRTEVAIACPD
jgi:hypothetical protein